MRAESVTTRNGTSGQAFPQASADTALDPEALGDWSNLKGTDYHLVYAIWLVLCSQVSEVAFYRGNDLRARPIAPPRLDGGRTLARLLPLVAHRPDEDIWIQLKSTDVAWSLTKLLQNNLLPNFISNAVQSQRAGRTWRAWLVSPARVDEKAIRRFLAHPERHSGSQKALGACVSRASARLRGAHVEGPSETALQQVAYAVLAQLADAKPAPLSTLRAEIERELAYAYPNSGAVRGLADLLLGAMLREAAQGPSNGHAYNAEWLDNAARRPLGRRDTLEHALIACTNVCRRTAADWDPTRHVERPRFTRMVEAFLSAPETLLVVTGADRIGKSWAIADCALRLLDGHVRLLVRDLDLGISANLARVVADQLQAETTADWHDDVFLRKLEAAAVVDQRPILLVDGLVVGAGAAENIARGLGRLVRQCGERGWKMILACREGPWTFGQLGAHIQVDHIYTPEPRVESRDTLLGESDRGESAKLQVYTSEPTMRSQDSLLGELDEAEFAQFLERRLDLSCARKAGLLLNADRYRLLRHPYFLERYLEQHRQDLCIRGEAPIASLDRLLDSRLATWLDHGGQLLECQPDELRPLLDALVAALWDARPNGLTLSKAAQIADRFLPGQGTSAIRHLRHLGLLSTQGSIQLAEQPIAARLFARHLERLSLIEPDVLGRLRLEFDAPVVVALCGGITQQPVRVAEKLLASDPRWLDPILAGVAQSARDTYEVLAWLTVLDRQQPQLVQAFHGAHTLGELAARSGRARRWVVCWNMSSKNWTRHRGEVALGALLGVAPLRAERILRLRLQWARETVDTDQRERRLHGAISPLGSISSGPAAEVGERCLTDFMHITDTLPAHVKNVAFDDEIDAARGAVALHDDKALERLIDELKDTDNRIRTRAARALLPIALDNPVRIREPLCLAIKVEQAPWVMGELLWTAQGLVQSAGTELVDSLDETRVWEDPLAAGFAFALLGELAAHDPARVRQLLPESLTDCAPADRAVLGEIHAYAWWRLAERLPEARTPLRALARLDLESIPQELRLFSLRGGVVAQLASVALDEIAPDALVARPQIFRSRDIQPLWVNTTEFFRSHANLLIGGSTGANLQQQLVSTLVDAAEIQVDVRQMAVRGARFLAASLCSELLSEIAKLADDPLPLLEQVPLEYRLRLASDLLATGRTEVRIQEYAHRLCVDAYHSVRSIEAQLERHRCLALLVALQDEPLSAQESYRAELADAFLAPAAQAHGLDILAATSPRATIQLLEHAIKGSEDLRTLFSWEEVASTWENYLIARVYSRMFDPRPIHTREARDLCKCMLTGLEGSTHSLEGVEHQAIYRHLLAQFEGVAMHLGDSSLRFERRDGLIPASHRLASRLLDFTTAPWSTSVAKSFRDMLYERNGWLDTIHLTIKDGSLSSGSGIYLIYMFPSVRLAAAAVGIHSGDVDPGGAMMRSRIAALSPIRESELLRRYSPTVQRARMPAILTNLERHIETDDRDERLWAALGDYHLRQGEFGKAEMALSRCLGLSWADKEVRSGTLYNLACVYARCSREAACRQVIEEWVALDPSQEALKHALRDEDLLLIQTSDWFHALLDDRLGRSGPFST